MGTVSAVSFLAPAKLNLSLEVYGKRPDGYHDIRSVMVPVSLYDEVTVEEASRGIALTCDAPGIPVDETNSCHRAAALFMKWAKAPSGVRIRLRKTIPAEGGLGGGSSDAAAALKGLASLTGKVPPGEGLRGMAAQVGADVPFFLLGRAALVEGFGDRLTPLLWETPFHAVIVLPPFGLSTREAYARLRRGFGDPPPAAPPPAIRSIEDAAAIVRNDFEEAWGPVCPEIGRIKKELQAAGACASGLTGSGSAVFGLFASVSGARRAENSLRAGGDGRRVFVAGNI